MSAQQQRERLLELLADRATEGLSAEDRDEFARLCAMFPDLAADNTFDMAAAAFDQAFAEFDDDAEIELPDNLRVKLMKSAASGRPYSGGLEEEALIGKRTVTNIASHSTGSQSTGSQGRQSAASQAETSGLPWGWMAAAAALLLAFAGWSQVLNQSVDSGDVAMSTVEQRNAMIATAGDLLDLNWSATEDPAAFGASGSVVWSASQNAGFMTFRGLQANDATEFQYQLWIFDKDRDQRYPVDGGVFDMPAGEDEVVVPIDAVLGVDAPVLFAITVEKPGGVVVSDRERIVLVAQPA